MLHHGEQSRAYGTLYPVQIAKQGYIKQLIRSDISNEEIERLEISLLNTLEKLMKVEAYTEAKKLIKDLTEIKLKKQEIQKVELSRLANKT